MRLSLRSRALLLITAIGVALFAYQAHRIQPAGLLARLAGISARMATTTSSAAMTSSNTTTKNRPAAVIALSHGGGPLPVLGDPDSASLAKSLRERVPAILGLDDAARRPRAIVVVTAHWSTTQPTISSGLRHRLLYDYGGFPAEAYRLRYEAPGAPDVAARCAELLRTAGFAPTLDADRGWDHGVFVPLLLVRPQADIPVVQLSVLHSEDPAAHFAMGHALANLRHENVAIVGSGFASFHNLRLMFTGAAADPAFRATLAQWNDAVSAAATIPSADDRDQRFRRWRDWPAAFIAHPKGGAEHFLPLVVCAGAAGDAAAKSYKDEYLGLDIFSYYWE